MGECETVGRMFSWGECVRLYGESVRQSETVVESVK